MPAIYYFLVGLAKGSSPDHLNFVVRTLSNPTVAVVIATLIPVLIIFGLVQAVAGASTYIERKVAADIQRRVGPNKCNVNAFLGEFVRGYVRDASAPGASGGRQLIAAAVKPLLPVLDIVDKLASRFAPGVLIFLADGVKLIMKEDIIPDAVDKPMFKIAPTLVLVSAFGACAALPYSDAWYVADFNNGLLFIAAVTSIEVLGILMAGWASNNKWALLGGMRSAAQIVSYELPVGLALLTGGMIAGTLSLQGIIYDQFNFHKDAQGYQLWLHQGWFWQWNLFHPAMFILAPVYFLAALAECNRTPFDIPEAESELVSGYHTEYSGMRFAFFFMGEYAMMCVTSAIAVTLFLGGWSTGIGPLEMLLVKVPPVVMNGMVAKPPEFHWYGTVLHLAMFCLKTYGLVFIMMWIRWTLPRFRVDQMMTLCWKKLIPLGMVCFFGVSVWMLLRMIIAAKIGPNGDAVIDNITFLLRIVFAFSVIGFIGWFFTKPLTTEQRSQRELLEKAGLNAGTAL